MSDLLSFVAKAIRQAEIEPEDFTAGASVLAALGGTQKSQVRQALTQAKEEGVELSQVGGLALLSNRPLVAAVLKESFGIQVVDYTTTGGEIGVYSEGGYPLLAYLAYMSTSDEEYSLLQKRALKWGADPQATWDIPAQIPSSMPDQEPRTISWVAENIRSTNAEIVELLCDKINVEPSTAEQERRLLALREAISRRSGNFYWDFKSVFDLFSPGGKFALDINPWDLSIEGKSLAYHNTVVLSRINRHDDHGKAIAAFEPWVVKTSPSHGEELMQIALACVEGKRNFIHLPGWVVEKLDTQQAQAVFKCGYVEMLKSWASDTFGGRSDGMLNGQPGNSLAENKLRSDSAFLNGLIPIATQAPCINGAQTPEFALANISAFELGKLTLQSLDALAAVYPKFPGAPDVAKSLDPLRDLLERKVPYSDPEFRRFHEACVLRAKANAEAGELKRGSGVAFAPTRAGPRL